MPSTVRRSLGTRDFQGAELRYFRVHMYATTAAMDGDSASATGRIAYVVETSRFYFGSNGSWTGLSTGSLWGDQVATVADLPVPSPHGEMRVVLNDGSGYGPSLYVFNLAAAPGSQWKKCADARIVLTDGTAHLTALLTVDDPVTNTPSADGHLTTKRFVDAQDAAVLGSANAHADGAVAAHVAAADPHPQYTTNIEATTIADAEAAAAVATHVSSYPHFSQVAIDGFADARIALHNADAAAHGGITTAFTAHVASSNPHPTAGFARAAQVATDITLAVTTHNTDASAHADIRALINGLSSGGGGTGTASDRVVVIGASTGGGHGSPVVRDQVVYDLFHPLTAADQKPDGILDFVSRVASVSTTLAFVATDASVTVADGTLFAMGDAFNPGTALNNRYFSITKINGNKLSLYPTPAAESVGSTTFNRYTGTARVVLSGDFNIQRVRPIKIGIAAIIANPGDGKAVLTLDESFSYFYGYNIIPATGSNITLSGLINGADNGTYVIDTVSPATRRISLTVPLLADQATAGGLAAVTSSAQSSNFVASAPAPIDYFVDITDPLKYSQTLGHYRIGRQVSNDQFIVDIEAAGFTRLAVNAAFTETVHVPKKVYLADSTSAAFVLALHAAPAENDRVTVKDVGGVAATHNITISGNGKFIDGSATQLMSYNRMSLTLVFINGAWIIE